jgi:putative toxin-antitoxin system antitoxin component (TIGR02293 family)
MTTLKINLETQLNKEISMFLKHSNLVVYQKGAKKETTFNDFLDNKMLIIGAIRAGFPYKIFDLIQLYAPFTEGDWADFLNVSAKSLQRYKLNNNHHFKPIHSEKIIEMAEVTKLGLEVFGNSEKLLLWLNTPNYAFGNLMPKELLKDSYGKEMVIAEFTRINHGILV